MPATSDMRPVVFSLDDHFIAPFLVTFHSLVSRGMLPAESDIFILHEQSLSPSSIRVVEARAQELGRSITFVNATDRLPNDLPISPKDHVSIATFFRLFVASLLPTTVSSALYLDSDLLVRHDIGDLLSLPLTASIAAVDHLSPPDELRLWGPKGGDYLQAGVLVFDLDAWRRSDQESRFLEILRTERHRIRLHDQDVLNLAFADNWQRLDIWNNVGFRAVAAIPEADLRERARIVHFDGADKPWTVDKPRVFRDEWYAEYQKVFGTRFDVRRLRRPLWRRAASSLKRRLRAAFASARPSGRIRRG